MCHTWVCIKFKLDSFPFGTSLCHKHTPLKHHYLHYSNSNNHSSGLNVNKIQVMIWRIRITSLTLLFFAHLYTQERRDQFGSGYLWKSLHSWAPGLVTSKKVIWLLKLYLKITTGYLKINRVCEQGTSFCNDDGHYFCKAVLRGEQRVFPKNKKKHWSFSVIFIFAWNITSILVILKHERVLMRPGKHVVMTAV